jgi:hypothetical protein
VHKAGEPARPGHFKVRVFFFEPHSGAYDYLRVDLPTNLSLFSGSHCHPSKVSDSCAAKLCYGSLPPANFEQEKPVFARGQFYRS